MDLLQDAFDKLYYAALRACDADIELSEEECNKAMTELWAVLRDTEKFCTKEKPQ